MTKEIGDEAPNVKRLTEEQRRLVEEHLGLVETLAKKMARKIPAYIISCEDLEQNGRLGLMDAATRYEADRVKFATFAPLRIIGAMKDAMRTSEGLLIRVPRNAWDERPHSEIYAMQSLRYEACGGEDEATGVAYQSLEAIAYEPDESPYDEDSIRHAVKCLGGCLTAAVVGSYYEGKTLKAVGDEIGVSESRVSQARAEALNRLRENPRILAYAS